MLTEELFFKLKDGREALIRSPREEDVLDILNYIRQAVRETEFLLLTPEESDRFTYENEKAFLEQIVNSKTDAMFVCFVNGRVVGNSQLRFNGNIKTKHRASIGIAILNEFWNLGIGTKLFEEMIKFAKEHGVLQLELEVSAANLRAIALYKKFGFEIAGTLPNANRLKTGKFVAQHYMLKIL